MKKPICAPQKVYPVLIGRFRPATVGCFWPVFFFADHRRGGTQIQLALVEVHGPHVMPKEAVRDQHVRGDCIETREVASVGEHAEGAHLAADRTDTRRQRVGESAGSSIRDLLFCGSQVPACFGGVHF